MTSFQDLEFLEKQISPTFSFHKQCTIVSFLANFLAYNQKMTEKSVFRKALSYLSSIQYLSSRYCAYPPFEQLRARYTTYYLSGVGYNWKFYKEIKFSSGLLPPKNLAVELGKATCRTMKA